MLLKDRINGMGKALNMLCLLVIHCHTSLFIIIKIKASHTYFEPYCLPQIPWFPVPPGYCPFRISEEGILQNPDLYSQAFFNLRSSTRNTLIEYFPLVFGLHSNTHGRFSVYKNIFREEFPVQTLPSVLSGLFICMEGSTAHRKEF